MKKKKIQKNNIGQDICGRDYFLARLNKVHRELLYYTGVGVRAGFSVSVGVGIHKC